MRKIDSIKDCIKISRIIGANSSLVIIPVLLAKNLANEIHEMKKHVKNIERGN